ncbi:spore coat protein [Priestia megaterium]|uniref:spore coat protein n=1 Tax=Priestia megaterium TaxID=1404 RepID=UPI000BA6CD60|nr:spore coat protein [Priestia megaterium]MCU7746744.1 spore coat protein [Priestia megaterium]PAK46021.1 spore coat protein X [Priestia megaterium]
MSSRDYYYYDLKKKSKVVKKNHCEDDCKVDFHKDDESSEERFDVEVLQDADQVSLIEQESKELIWIKDSCDIRVRTTDTQAAVALQVALQVAIAVVIRIAIGDNIEDNGVFQDLLQLSEIEQVNKQQIFIENSKDVTVTTSDTDVALNIQVLVQILVAIIVILDIF